MKLNKSYLQNLTNGQLVHPGITLSKVNQPNKLKEFYFMLH